MCSGDNEARFEVHINPHLENVTSMSVTPFLRYEIETTSSLGIPGPEVPL